MSDDMYIVEIDGKRYEIALEVAELIVGQGEELEVLRKKKAATEGAILKIVDKVKVLV